MVRIPNGVRTRVPAVKGRCPRPLDDGDLCVVSPSTEVRWRPQNYRGLRANALTEVSLSGLLWLIGPRLPPLSQPE